jgi:hypothetical protein
LIECYNLLLLLIFSCILNTTTTMGLFDWLKGAAQKVWGAVRKPFDWLGKGVGWVADKAHRGISWIKDKVVDPVLNSAVGRTVTGLIPQGIKDSIGGIYNGAMNGLKTASSGNLMDVIKGAGEVGSAAAAARKGIAPAVGEISRRGIMPVLDDVYTKATTPIRDAAGRLTAAPLTEAIFKSGLYKPGEKPSIKWMKPVA